MECEEPLVRPAVVVRAAQYYSMAAVAVESVFGEIIGTTERMVGSGRGRASLVWPKLDVLSAETESGSSGTSFEDGRPNGVSVLLGMLGKEHGYVVQHKGLMLLKQAVRHPDVVFELGRLGGHKRLLTILEECMSCVESMATDTPSPNSEDVAEAAAAVVSLCSSAKGLGTTARFPMNRSAAPQEAPLILRLLDLAGKEARGKSSLPVGSKGFDDRLFVRFVAGRQTSQYGVGYVLWPSASVLVKWMTASKERLAELRAAKTILELGAGVGLTSMMLSPYAGPITATDFNPQVVENLAVNVEVNSWLTANTAPISVKTLDWGTVPDRARADEAPSGEVDEGKSEEDLGVLSPALRYDMIIATDAVCCDRDAELLVNAVRHFLAPGGVAYVATPPPASRYGVDNIESSAAKSGLTVTKMVVPEDIARASDGSDYLVQILALNSACE